MPRSIWKYAISFGLAHIQVALLNVGLPRSISLIEILGEQYPRAELCRVFGVNRSSVYDASTCYSAHPEEK